MISQPRQVLSRAAGRLWSRLTEETNISSRHLPVLCYHAISDEPHTVSPARFAAQMRWLRSRGYESVGLELVTDPPPGRNRYVVITFDDGLAGLRANALPALAECGFQATVFFPPALAGATVWYSPQERGFVAAAQDGAKRLEFMSWEDADSMAAAGMCFQSHGWSHARLPGLAEQDATAELLRSRHALEARFGQPVRFLSYPFGDFDDRVQRIAASLGYAAAVTTLPGVNSPRDNPFALRRIAPNPGDDLSSFAFKLSPAAGWCYRWGKAERSGAQ